MTSKTTNGYTLLEVVISMSVMVLTLGSVLGFVKIGTENSRSIAKVSKLDREADRVLQIIIRELSHAGADTITPIDPGGGSSISYQRALGYDEEVQWSSPTRIELRPDAADADDGIDNNSNGLVDEGQIVLVTNAGLVNERERVLVSRVSEFLGGEFANGLDDNGNGVVDERGLSFVSDGLSLTVRLTLSDRDPEGRIYLRTFETSVTPRN